MKMKNFVVVMSVLCLLGIIISLPFKALSGTNGPEITDVLVRPRIGVPVNQTSPSPVVEIKQLSIKNIEIIQLNTEVTESSVNKTIDKIKKANRNSKLVAIYLLLDTPGGSVFDGTRLITAMDNSKLPIYTICTEGCYSMGAQILEHGKLRYAIDRATVMFHPASMGLMIDGEVDKIFSRIEYSKKSIDKLDAYNANRAGMSYDTFKLHVSREYWMDSEEALSFHFIDGIVTLDFEKEQSTLPLFGNKLKIKLED